MAKRTWIHSEAALQTTVSLILVTMQALALDGLLKLLCSHYNKQGNRPATVSSTLHSDLWFKVTQPLSSEIDGSLLCQQPR